MLSINQYFWLNNGNNSRLLAKIRIHRLEVSIFMVTGAWGGPSLGRCEVLAPMRYTDRAFAKCAPASNIPLQTLWESKNRVEGYTFHPGDRADPSALIDLYPGIIPRPCKKYAVSSLSMYRVKVSLCRITAETYFQYLGRKSAVLNRCAASSRILKTSWFKSFLHCIWALVCCNNTLLINNHLLSDQWKSMLRWHRYSLSDVGGCSNSLPMCTCSS